MANPITIESVQSIASLKAGVLAPVNRSYNINVECDANGSPIVPPDSSMSAVFFRNPTHDINMQLSTTATPGTPDIFSIQPPVNEVWYVLQLTTIIVDGGMSPITYGGLAALPNGCLFRKVGKANLPSDPVITLMDITDGIPIIDNALLTLDAGDFSHYDATGATDMIEFSLPILQRFRKASVLDGALLQRLEYVIQDNMTGLNRHHIKSVVSKIDIA